MVLLRVILAIMACAFLQGCMNVAMSGAQAAYNHHSLEQNVKDQYVSMQINQKINPQLDPRFENTNIAVATYNGEVLLAGQVPEPWQRAEVGKIAKALPNVNDVYNLLVVTNPSSSLVRMSDAWITTKVKAKLMASEDVDVTQVKVVTENGVVYLMGILLPEQAAAAVDLARNTDGVESVVKVFSYIKITKKL